MANQRHFSSKFCYLSQNKFQALNSLSNNNRGWETNTGNNSVFIVALMKPSQETDCRPPSLPLRNLYAESKKQQLELDRNMGLVPNSRKRCQGCILSPCLAQLHHKLPSCQNTGWMKLKLESGAGEISITSITQTALHSNMWKARGTKDESERRVKNWLKSQHSKKWRSIHLVP